MRGQKFKSPHRTERLAVYSPKGPVHLIDSNFREVTFSGRPLIHSRQRIKYHWAFLAIDRDLFHFAEILDIIGYPIKAYGALDVFLAYL